MATTGARHTIDLISAATAQGALRFAAFDGGFNAERFIEFCQRLLHDAPGPVHLVVDGHPAHRAKPTTDFVATTGGRLRLFFLPGYAPELNPDEWVCKNVKHDRIGPVGITNATDLKAKATNTPRRLQRLPQPVRAFFTDPHPRYITARKSTYLHSPW